VDVLQKKYDICYGAVTDLENKKKIPMGPIDRIRHKKLAENVTDQRINPGWSNVKRKRSREVRGGSGPGQGAVAVTATGKNRIMIFGPKDDGTYVVEFRTSDGRALATSIPRTEAHVIRHFQEQIPYGLFVPEVAGE